MLKSLNRRVTHFQTLTFRHLLQSEETKPLLCSGPSLIQKDSNYAAVAMQCSKSVAFLFQSQI